MSVTDLPSLNAALNGTSALLLLTGYGFVRARRLRAHTVCMILALVSSSLFLVSYLTYHAQVGSMPYRGTGWTRPVYFTILISHTILAAAVVPLALVTVGRAARRRFDRHRAIARFTLPVWLYVSVTGVIIYLMLYGLPRAEARLRPSPGPVLKSAGLSEGRWLTPPR